MKEIKFRAWSKADLHWVYSKPMPDMGFWKWVSYDSTTIFNEWTGLKDKNGKEIYEGDVVKSLERIYRIDFEPGAIGMRLLTSEKNRPSYRLLNILGNVEVIGNIYENPELALSK